MQVERVGGGKSGENGFALIGEVLKLSKNKGRLGTPRSVMNQAMCNPVKNKTAAQSVLFLTSSSNPLNRQPKGKTLMILNNTDLKCPVEFILFLKEAGLYSQVLFMSI